MPNTRSDTTRLSEGTIIRYGKDDIYYALTDNSVTPKQFLLTREELLALVDYTIDMVMTGEERHGIWNMLEESYGEDNK